MLSLRAYLDSGVPLDVLPELQRLAEAVVVDRREQSREWLAQAARGCRRLASGLRADPAHEDLARVLSWAAEAYEDDELARRFEQALPQEVLGQLLANADEACHPHRLLVTPAGSFSCSACSDKYVDSRGIVVQATDGITYCRHCIGIAAAVLSEVPESPSAAGKRSSPSSRACTTTRRRHRVGVGALLVVAMLASSVGMASGGLLPRPLQDIVERTLARLGIDIPSAPAGCTAGAAAICEEAIQSAIGLHDGIGHLRAEGGPAGEGGSTASIGNSATLGAVATVDQQPPLGGGQHPAAEAPAHAEPNNGGLGPQSIGGSFDGRGVTPVVTSSPTTATPGTSRRVAESVAPSVPTSESVPVAQPTPPPAGSAPSVPSPDDSAPEAAVAAQSLVGSQDPAGLRGDLDALVGPPPETSGGEATSPLLAAPGPALPLGGSGAA